MKSTLIATVLLSSLTLLAQGPRGPQGRTGSALNMAKVQTISGPVTAVNIAYGAQYPSITINKLQIKVAPVWYLLDKNFEIKAGDVLTVSAAPSTLPNDAYLYAIEISNPAKNLKLTLRDSSGVPLWSGPGRGRGNPDAPRNGAGCIDPASIKTVTGVIEKLSMGLGVQMPTLVLRAGTQLLTLKIGPERILLDADFELKEGQTITVRYGRETYEDEYVALQITNAAGQTVKLRDDDGSPNWN